MSLDANARRFSGFADLYDAVRPTPPRLLADVIIRYDRALRRTFVNVKYKDLIDSMYERSEG